jgi:hypothetical protein
VSLLRPCVPELKLAQKRYGKKLRFVFRHFPLTEAHPFAEMAAEAAEYAGAHGRFWEMHDGLYANQDQVGLTLILGLGRALGLSDRGLRDTLAQRRYAAKIQADFLGGVRSKMTKSIWRMMTCRLTARSPPRSRLRTRTPPRATDCSEPSRKSRTRAAAPSEAWRMRANTEFLTLRPSFCRSQIVCSGRSPRRRIGLIKPPPTPCFWMAFATLRQLLATLGRFGVRRIEALGASFDPHLHEAMAEVDDDPRPPGSGVRVLEDGYMIHDRLLRPARVIVAKLRLEVAPPVDATSSA